MERPLDNLPGKPGRDCRVLRFKPEDIDITFTPEGTVVKARNHVFTHGDKLPRLTRIHGKLEEENYTYPVVAAKDLSVPGSIPLPNASSAAVVISKRSHPKKLMLLIMLWSTESQLSAQGRVFEASQLEFDDGDLVYEIT
jgi:hypothetical protein